MSDIEKVLANLNPKFRKTLGLASDAPAPDYQPLPSVGLNRALGGGLVYGRQVLVWGSKSSAKSSLCLQTIGLAQKEGKVCAWIDAEMSYDESWARRLGVDSDKLIYSTARTINDMVDIGVALMEAGVDLIVVDSITSLLPAIYFEKDSSTLKDLDKTKQIGAESRDMGNAVKMLNYANNRNGNTLLILISQARNNINAMYTQSVPTGGNATKFYSSTIIKLFSSESDAKAIRSTKEVGDKLLGDKIGRKVLWELQFSKTSPGFQSGEYDFYFRGDSIGVDSIGELADMAISLGHIEKAGAWLNMDDGQRFHGRDKLVVAMKEDDSLRQRLLELCSE